MESRRITRRRFLERAAALAAAPLAARAVALGQSPGRTDAAAKRILLIGHKPDHPHGTHMYLRWCELLAKCLNQTKGVEAVVSDGWPKDAAALKDLAAAFTYGSPGADRLLTGDVGKAFEDLLKQGVGFAALHWGTGVQAKGDELANRWLAALGGYWRHNVGLTITKSKVEQVAKDHPICRGWSDYELKDEFYLNPTISPQATTLFKVKVKGRRDPEPKDLTVAWAFERPDSNGGRSYGNTLGHFHELLGVEAFRRAIVNGILWVARCEVPKDGAPCALTEEDLKLPVAPPRPKR